jgi:hypothetical protein
MVTVIAFYPGGGGNRFYKWLHGQKEFALNCRYDGVNPYQAVINRYPSLETKIQLVKHPVIFTHCVNYDFIDECWPGPKKLYFIDADRHRCLSRQWALFEKKISINQHPVGGPFSTIAWNDLYYTQYPWQSGPGIVVDKNNFLEFSLMIEQELNSIVCPEFDFAQQMFNQYGATAPILDLYDQYYSSYQLKSRN